MCHESRLEQTLNEHKISACSQIFSSSDLVFRSRRDQDPCARYRRLLACARPSWRNLRERCRKTDIYIIPSLQRFKRKADRRLTRHQGPPSLQDYERDGQIRSKRLAGTKLAAKSIIVILVFEVIRPIDALINLGIMNRRSRADPNMSEPALSLKRFE